MTGGWATQAKQRLLTTAKAFLTPEMDLDIFLVVWCNVYVMWDKRSDLRPQTPPTAWSACGRPRWCSAPPSCWAARGPPASRSARVWSPPTQSGCPSPAGTRPQRSSGCGPAGWPPWHLWRHAPWDLSFPAMWGVLLRQCQTLNPKWHFGLSVCIRSRLQK